MSTPRVDYEDALHGALVECVSAMGALKMHPDPIPGATGYLSDRDTWAKHALEHMEAVAKLLDKALREREAGDVN